MQNASVRPGLKRRLRCCRNSTGFYSEIRLLQDSDKTTLRAEGEETKANKKIKQKTTPRVGTLREPEKTKDYKLTALRTS